MELPPDVAEVLLTEEMIQDKIHELAKRITDDYRDRDLLLVCLLYTSPSPRDLSTSRMPSSA